nr:hypothetical protein HK105_004123 [Polyrhizophydium stewartii]
MPPADTAPPGSPPRRPSRIDPAELRERSLPSIHSKGASHEAHPTAVAVQVHAVRLPDSLRPSAVTLLLRRDKRRLPVAPYAQCVSLPLSYHKLVFDVLKLDVFQTRIITTTRIAQLRLRLADLPRFDGEFVHELPLFSPASPETQIGTIELHLAFSADPSAVDASQVGANGVSIASGDDASSFESQEQRDIIELIGAFEAARVERDREQAQLDAATGGSASSVSSASSASLASPTSQVPSSHSTTIDPIHPNRKLASHRTSALARRTVVGLTENTLGGLKDLAETAAAFLGTGWKMSKADLASAMLLLSDMQREHPTERTHNVVTDPQQLRIAAYFMDFVLPSYGAVVLNYFGYGRGFLRDALRINPDRKAVLDHAKLAPADILAWEFGLPELFKPNFYIAHDRRTDAIVLTIRGTLVRPARRAAPSLAAPC